MKILSYKLDADAVLEKHATHWTATEEEELMKAILTYDSVIILQHLYKSGRSIHSSLNRKCVKDAGYLFIYHSPRNYEFLSPDKEVILARQSINEFISTFQAVLKCQEGLSQAILDFRRSDKPIPLSDLASKYKVGKNFLKGVLIKNSDIIKVGKKYYKIDDSMIIK